MGPLNTTTGRPARRSSARCKLAITRRLVASTSASKSACISAWPVPVLGQEGHDAPTQLRRQALIEDAAHLGRATGLAEMHQHDGFGAQRVRARDDFVQVHVHL